MSVFDSILILDNINESDDRSYARKSYVGVDSGPGGMVGRDDPKMYANNNFGRVLRSQLSGMGADYGVEVSDFGKGVTVRVTCSNYISGRSVSKTFLILFEYKGDGIVFTSSTKWRTISGVDQAASYIKSACNSMQSDAARKL